MHALCQPVQYGLLLPSGAIGLVPTGLWECYPRHWHQCRPLRCFLWRRPYEMKQTACQNYQAGV